jgi:predicted RNase H-like nuclease (RuvC/YqgF family)
MTDHDETRATAEFVERREARWREWLELDESDDDGGLATIAAHLETEIERVRKLFEPLLARLDHQISVLGAKVRKQADEITELRARLEQAQVEAERIAEAKHQIARQAAYNRVRERALAHSHKPAAAIVSLATRRGERHG